jgi:hypothetical protein
MSTVPSLRIIGPTSSKHFSTSPSIWGTPYVSYFPSNSLPSVPTPISSIIIPTYICSSGGGLSLGFNMGRGVPSTYTILVSVPTLLGVGLTFIWNIPSGFGAVPG